jgi:hypothetical protein
VPRWYDVVASPCHLFSRDHDHVAETSRVDHYRAPCGNRRITLLVPTSVGWDDRCVPLSYKKGNPPAVLQLPSLAYFRARQCRRSCFLLRLVLVNPPLAHPVVASPTHWASCLAVFVDDLQKKLEEDREKNPSSIVDHASVRGDDRVPPLDACSDVPLHRQQSLSSVSFPCTHTSPASSWTVLRQWGEHHVSFTIYEFSLSRNISEYIFRLVTLVLLESVALILLSNLGTRFCLRGVGCDAPGFQPGSLTLMIRSTELTLVKRWSTWAITSKTSPTIPNDTPWSTHGQGLVKTLVKPLESLLTH